MDVSPKVPVTILSGQLGSGKSTLLRRILTAQTRYKIAIVMNEFAQTANIEGKAIQLTVAKEGTEVQEWLELDNGCLCCSAQDQGVLAIESLMQRRGTFDYIIIETTDGIVTVVDCVNLEKQLEEEAVENGGTVTKQIAVADSLYLSKTDVTSESVLVSAKSRIRRINTSAALNDCGDGLDEILSQILNLDAFSTYRRVPKLSQGEASQTTPPSGLMGRLAPQVGQLSEADFRTTHEAFSNITIPLPTLDTVNTSDSRFDITFRRLLWEGLIGDECVEDLPADGNEPRILRAKGLLEDSAGNWFILQGVRDTYEIQQISQVCDEMPKLVLIGKGLDQRMAERFLDEISQARVKVE